MKTASALFLVVFGMLLSFVTVHAADAPGELDPKKILEAIPKELLKDISGNPAKRKEAIDAASQKLQEKYRDQASSLTIRVRNTNKSNGRYYAHAEQERVRVSGTNFTVHFNINLDESENEKAARIKPGDKITASGRAYVSLYGSGSNYTSLTISVNDAKLK
ncbi:MAG: hypothetical protein CJBNEKGG_02350 [Prosthecobacter sp.]|nr:hypothetical protein [Prosthecobacter sp.]